MGEITLPADDGEALHREICAGEVRIRAVSDASVKDGTTAHAWVFEGLSVDIRVEGAGPVDGDPLHMDSYQGEVIGALAMAYSLCAMLEYYGRPSRAVTVNFYCNNKAVSEESEIPIKGRGLKTYLGPEFDARAELQGVLADLKEQGVTVRRNWVKGHQDEEVPQEELSRELLLNIDCDVRAGMFQATPPRELEPRVCSP